MTHASSFTRAQEPGRYVAFEPTPEPAENDFRRGDFHNGFPTSENGPDFAAIREHPDFVRVRRRLTRVIFPASALFLVWYLTYVLLAAYAPDFMATKAFGSVTVGLLLGLSQFVTTIVIMLWYSRFARTKIDPEIDALRDMAGENDHER